MRKLGENLRLRRSTVQGAGQGLPDRLGYYGTGVVRRAGDHPLIYRFWFRYIKKRVALGARFLEIGCGPGHLLRRFQRSYRGFGLDLSIYAAEQARFASDRPTICGDARGLPFLPGCFEFAVALDVVEHVAQPEQVLEELFRVCKPSALLILSTPNPDSIGRKWKKKAWFGHRDTTHVMIQQDWFWRRLFADSGWHVVEAGTSSLWDPPYFRWVPRLIQFLVFHAISYVTECFTAIVPWRFGENLVYVLKKPAP